MSPAFRPLPSRLAATVNRSCRAAVCSTVSAAICLSLTACASLSSGSGSGSAATAAPAAAGCEKLPSTSNKEKIAIGAAVGAVTGAVIGNAASDKHKGRHRTQGALGGALAGALVGAAFGNEIDIEEQADGSVKLKIPGSVMFASGQSSLSPGFQDTLSRVTLSIKKYCGVTVRAVGHTDNVGAASANQTLSEARARSVVRYMQAQGFDSQRLVAEGRGPTEPLVANVDDASRQRNRRVELFVRPPAG